MTSERNNANPSASREVVIRRATAEDANVIANHRLSMFRDMGYGDDAALESMKAKFQPWVEAKLKSGDYLGWLAAIQGDFVVAGTGLWLMDWPAHMLVSNPRRGNILNVYTEPQFRQRGLAGSLLKTALRWCNENQVDFVILHASPQGRKIYEDLGFTSSNEMRLKL